MRVQIASDLHLERSPDLKFEDIIDCSKNANVLVLAGDIGCPLQAGYTAFLKACTERFPTVLVTAGNHEYKTCASGKCGPPLTMQEVDAMIENICVSVSSPGHRAVYLQNGKNICLDDVNFVGATLWSHIPLHVFSKHDIDLIGNTYFSNMMVVPGEAFDVDRCNRMFKDTIDKIAASTRWGQANGKKNVVITHHAPLMEGAFKRADLPKNYLYGTDMSQHLDGKVIKAWIYGHTHWNDVNCVNGTLCVCNQYGGKGTVASGWNKAFTVWV